MTGARTTSGLAITGLGLSQALAPHTAARVFGLDPLDGQAAWLARLLGVSNLALGALGLDDEPSARSIAVERAVLAGNALVTLAAAAGGGLPKRTAVMVLGFVGALVAADVAGSRG